MRPRAASTPSTPARPRLASGCRWRRSCSAGTRPTPGWSTTSAASPRAPSGAGRGRAVACGWTPTATTRSTPRPSGHGGSVPSSVRELAPGRRRLGGPARRRRRGRPPCVRARPGRGRVGRGARRPGQGPVPRTGLRGRSGALRARLRRLPPGAQRGRRRPGGAHLLLDHRQRPRRLGCPERMARASPHHPRGSRRGRPEHGWVLIIRAFSEPDARAREALLREAIAVGRLLGDADLEFEALSHLGGLFVMTDRVEEGLVLLDESLAAACAGELTDLATVDSIFCGFFWACELVNDVPRADQWMRAAADLMQRRNVVAAFCRPHYGGILTAAGRWNQAETELLAAARHFDRGLSARRDAAIIRLGDLRVRQGRLEEAARLLEGLEHHPDAVRALAALHLALEGSRGRSFRWSARGRAWSWRARSRSARPRSRSPKRRRPWRTSSGWRPPVTPTPPRRCCDRSVPPSGPVPRGSAR